MGTSRSGGECPRGWAGEPQHFSKSDYFLVVFDQSPPPLPGQLTTHAPGPFPGCPVHKWVETGPLRPSPPEASGPPRTAQDRDARVEQGLCALSPALGWIPSRARLLKPSCVSTALEATPRGRVPSPPLHLPGACASWSSSFLSSAWHSPLTSATGNLTVIHTPRREDCGGGCGVGELLLSAAFPSLPDPHRVL